MRLPALLCLCLCLLAVRLDAQPPAMTAHPLDPLSKEEIATVTAVLRDAGKATPTRRFSLVHLKEPAKADVLAWKPGAPLAREALAVLYEWSTNTTSEGVVDLGARKLVSWRDVPNAQPPLLEEDHQRTADILTRDPRWLEAMRNRRVDPRTVEIYGYPAGGNASPAPDGARLVMAATVYRAPRLGLVEGLTAIVNLTNGQVIRFEDSGVQPPALPASAYFSSEALPPARPAPKPLRITQPEGASFQVIGNEIRWQKWRFRFGMHPRVGLVLYTVGYEDGGRVRPVLYRAALSELVVPYGDPSWIFINPFDAGEVGLGNYARSPLTGPGDVPENATFFSAAMHDGFGNPVEVPRAVAVYERDGGLLWRHGDESRRARQLVLSSFAMVDNYDYGFNWIFGQDGSLECEVLLTGIMNFKGVNRAKEGQGTHPARAYGHLVAPNIEAPNHQHFFNFRLDMDVDGPDGNTVVETNTEAVPEGADNPYGNGFVMRDTPLRKESEAQRQVNVATSRRWRIENPNVRNTLGHASAYLLLPGENAVPMAAPTSWVRKKAGFLNAHLWVTPYRAEEQYAAGDYVNLGPLGDGLPRWTGSNRPIESTDVVLWYTVGVTHLPRPEEWPVMPVHRAGFRLVPAGFFSRNPALDTAKGR